jgi:hypothetical protein
VKVSTKKVTLSIDSEVTVMVDARSVISSMMVKGVIVGVTWEVRLVKSLYI